MAEEVLPISLTKADLQRRLAEWPDNLETTWALAFISVVPSGGELQAIRQAAKLCDRVLVARLTPDRVAPPNLSQTVKDAGADILWCPKEVTGWARVDLGVENVAVEISTLMMQAVTLCLPSLVVAPRENIPLIRALRNMQESFGDLFTLRITQAK